MTRNGDGNAGFDRRRLLVGGGMLVAYGGLGALAWRSGAVRMLTGVGDTEPLDVAEFAAMGTYLKVTTPRGSGSRAVKPAVEAVAEVERRMSYFLADSELSRLNAALAGEPFQLSGELAAVLAAASRVHRLSDGAFDPTVPPLLRTWGFRDGAPTRRPAPSDVRAALEHTGLERMAINGDTVTFSQEAMSTDLGGIAKGHGVDRAAAALSAAGVPGLVNSGGDIRAAGARPNGQPWLVGVRDPITRGRVFATVRLAADGAVATSGTYEQYVELDGTRVPHVLDPRSGEPVGEVVSATVVAGTALEADALATACVVLGRERSLALLENLPGVEGLVVARRERGRHRIETTSGFDGRILHAV